ncbi:MAG: hypothetical protein N3A69_02415 [Leptospiraceae bacterium]|nr:hypothetical protein [Leptospiraceae bacterium]
MQRAILEQYLEILKDLQFLIQNKDFAFIQKEGERSPESFHFEWVDFNIETQTKPKLKKILPVFAKDRNALCSLCPDRQLPLKNFFQKGEFPVLVLHYTGEFRKGQKTFFKSEKSILRSPEVEDILNRLLYKVFGKTLTQFYFQEYPACIFNHERSTEKDWENRVENCWTLVEKTVIEYQIQGIILTGSAAVLKYGLEKAKELTGKIQEISISSKKIPLIVLRSADAILALEQKRKRLEKNKNSPEYKQAREEENKVKQSIVNYMTLFKERLNI